MTTRVKKILATVLTVASLSASPVATSAGATPAAAIPVDPRPNVVLITADDMRLDDLKYMDFTRRLIRGSGATYTNFVSPHPLCCPARAELLTGQYAHNNGVYHNHGPNGGWQSLAAKENTLFKWLHDAGYRTAALGKFLNGYTGDAAGQIPGLDDNELYTQGIYNSYGFTSFDTGRHEDIHTTSWVAKRSQQLIRDYAGPGDPFFLWASQVAPHVMKKNGRWAAPTAPAGYRLKDQDRRPLSQRSAAYDDSGMRRWVRRQHEGRTISLYAVDHSVRKIVRTLQDTGEWQNTVLVFTSDNGYLMAEHNLQGKNHPHDEALRVPFGMVGPGINPGRDSRLTTLVDLASTIADVAGVAPGLEQDGRSLLQGKAYSSLLIQAGADGGGWKWRGVRTPRWTYARNTLGKPVLFDRLKDPYETKNLAKRKPRVRRQLAARTRALQDCSGASCRD